MSNAIETAKFLRRYQSWRKGEIDVFYPDSHAGPNPVEISAAIDRAIAALEAQPPCGTDGALPTFEQCDDAGLRGNPTALETFIYNNDPAGREESKRFRAELAAVLASQPAAPVAPATVAVPDGWRVKDDGHCVSVCWDGACYTLDDRQGSVYEAFCGFVRDVVKCAATQPQAAQAVPEMERVAWQRLDDGGSPLPIFITVRENLSARCRYREVFAASQREGGAS